MRRGLISVAVGAVLAAALTGQQAQAGTDATRAIAVHNSTARVAGVVSVASLPRAVGHALGTGAPRRVPLGAIAGSDSAGPAAAPAATDARRPLLAIAPGTQLTPALTNGDNTSSLTPPDMAVGADTTHVVQMVNDVGKIWTGGTPGSAFQLSSFFLAGSDFVSDPWVIFDQESGRWFAGIFDVTLGGELLAISSTGNPTGAWLVYAIQYPGVAGGGCPDQGKGGVDSNVVALGFNEFSGNGCTGGFLGAGLEVFNKADMLAGLTVHFTYTNPLPSYFSLIPAQALSSGQTTEYFVSNDGNSTSTKLHRVTSVGTPNVGAGVTLSALADLTLAHTYPSPPTAAQKGTTTKLASGDQRTQHVVWKSGVGLVTSWTEGCTPAGDTKVRDCARVVATNDGVGGPAVTMDTDLGKKAQYYVYPAATLNSANDVVVAFEVTSSKLFPQLDAASATVGGAFTAPIVLVTGTAANTTKRFGDYSAVALDPSGTANKNVWAAGEVGGPAGNSWQTGVREVNVTP